ncbi:MAG: TIGR02466 family protein [Alphaproteobacteria bacterium]
MGTAQARACFCGPTPETGECWIVTQGLDANVQNLFPTPVAIAILPDGAALNLELSKSILARERTQESHSHSNLGGWQSSWDIAEWGGAAAQRVVEAGISIANRLTTDRQGKPVKIDWKINAWANVNRKGHGNEFHTHPGAYWSCIYYVDDGGIPERPDLGGELEIQDPRGVAPAMYAPMLAFATPGGLTAGASELLLPKAGMLIAFPSWLSHAVRPYRGERLRISVAFNLSV